MSQNILGTVFASLLNSLWQSTAIALLVWAALRSLPRMGVEINAATRCAVWWAVLAAMLLLPVAPQHFTPHAVAAGVPSDIPIQAAPAPAASVAQPATPDAFSPVSPAWVSPAWAPIEITGGVFLILALALWLTLSSLRIVQIVRSYRYLRGIKQRGRPVTPEQRVNFDYWVLACAIDRPVRLLVSSEIVSPMAVGFRQPVVLVPETLMHQFSTEEVDHVILHELAHIARLDDWTNLFARLTCALLPLHPVAFWVVGRIQQDREIACDDWVVAMTGDARPYAASLSRLFELCAVRRRELLATGMADRASHLGERIEALLRSGRDFAPRVSLLRLALGAVILAGLVLAGAAAPHWIAFAQAPAAQEPVAQELVARPEPPLAPLPALAPEPSLAPLPALAPVSTIAPLAALEAAAAQQPRDLERGVQDVAQADDQLRAAKDQIRAAEAQLQAQKAQMLTAQAQLRAAKAGAERANGAPSGSFLAALVAAGYGGISVDEIIELRNHGVSAEFLRTLGQSGIGKLSTKDLILLTDNGVQPGIFRALREAFPQVTAKEIVEAAQNGVQPDDLRQAHEFSPNLTLPQIIRLKQAGVI